MARAGGLAVKALSKVPRAGRGLSAALRKAGQRSQRATSCALNSFDGATLVTLADGSRVPIETLTVGDRVLAWDPDSGQTLAYPVSATWVHEDPVTGIVVIAGEAIATTPAHPFYVIGRGWVEAAELALGDRVPSAAGGPGTVEAISWSRGPDTMYDLTVAVAHTFFVGSGGWLVHNCNVPHPRNSQSWIGDTDVYVIRDAVGRAMKIGESAAGRTAAGLSRRAEAQVARLQRATGGRFSSEIRRTLPTKRAAVGYQTRLIERFRRRYGEDTLPFNLNNR